VRVINVGNALDHAIVNLMAGGAFAYRPVRSLGPAPFTLNQGGIISASGESAR